MPRTEEKLEFEDLSDRAEQGTMAAFLRNAVRLSIRLPFLLMLGCSLVFVFGFKKLLRGLFRTRRAERVVPEDEPAEGRPHSR